MFLTDLYADLKANNGFSRNAKDQIPTKGYVVAVNNDDYNTHLDHFPTMREFGIAFDKATEGIDSILDAVWESGKSVEAARENITYGGWVDSETGHFYLDVGYVFSEEANAQAGAIEEKQIAYWDVANAREVRV